jgi:ADP-L-glycero-D-manno-heptose 6-epimerase
MNGTLPAGRVVVTGGAGLIGSALVWQLNAEGIEDILVVDRLGRSEKWRHLVPLRFRDYVEAEAFYPRLSAEPAAFGPISAVYHLGACSDTTERDAGYLIDNNYRRSQEIARWALGRDARFVYASSAATYGALERDLREDRDPHALAPLNMYGYSKHLFDLWLRAEGLLDRVVGCKYFNIFGPNEDHKGDMRSMVAKAYEQIGRDGRIRLFKSYRDGIADGEQTRDFLYVKDAVAATVHLGRSPSAGGLYNIGSGVARSWNDLALAIFAALRRAVAIEYIPMPETLRGKYQYRTEATVDRLRASGYRHAFTSLEDAVADYVRNYLLTGAVLGAAASAEVGTPVASATR